VSWVECTRSGENRSLGERDLAVGSCQDEHRNAQRVNTNAFVGADSRDGLVVRHNGLPTRGLVPGTVVLLDAIVYIIYIMRNGISPDQLDLALDHFSPTCQFF